jgi:hypothetical protein
MKIRESTFIRVLFFLMILIVFILVSLFTRHNIRLFNEFYSIIIFFSAYLTVGSVKIDKVNIVSPVNLMLFVFFMRLVICPITIIFFGYQKWVIPFTPTNTEVFKSYLLVFLSFYCFVIGWDLVKQTYKQLLPVKNEKVTFRNNSVLAVLLLSLMVLLIFIMYGSFSAYLNSIYLEDYHKYVTNSNKLLLYLFLLIKYAVPFFAIISGIYILDRINGDVYISGIITAMFVILIVLFALGPSRNNIVFPVLAFLSAVIPRYLRLKLRDFILACVLFLIVAFLFQNLRWKRNRDVLSKLNSTEKFIEFIQVYFNAPHIMTPTFRADEKLKKVPFTLDASLLESIPVIGIPFRSRSGSFVYNVAYANPNGRDQVFPAPAEVFINSGYIGVVFIFLLIGYLYRKIDLFFHNRTYEDPVFRAIIFYLALVFNATIFLSFSVMGQFIFYNCILIGIIMLLRDKQRPVPENIQNEKAY